MTQPILIHTKYIHNIIVITEKKEEYILNKHY